MLIVNARAFRHSDCAIDLQGEAKSTVSRKIFASTQYFGGATQSDI